MLIWHEQPSVWTQICMPVLSNLLSPESTFPWRTIASGPAATRRTASFGHAVSSERISLGGTRQRHCDQEHRTIASCRIVGEPCASALGCRQSHKPDGELKK